MTKTWFITGTSRGFGRIWAEAALERGDQVAATARNVESLRELNAQYGDRVLTLALDVTDKAAVERTVRQAHDYFGRLDVIVNNAGGVSSVSDAASLQEAAAYAWEELGGNLAMPATDIEGVGRVARLTDPYGARFAVIKSAPQQPQQG